ncbi:MAG: hypothetical protein JO322_13955 [Candidatus Eremiobacteraeota bacterium]|nr:hypothetical protein [Candidatus Eremiobacteraeota bacterium]
MLKRTLFAAGVLAVIGLVACNGNPSAVPTPGPTCNPNVTSQLIYPAPGATKVPGTISEIVVAVSSPLPANEYNLQLTNTANTGNVAQTANLLVVIPASQLPAGSAPATIPNPTYEAVGLVNSLYVNFNPGTQLQAALNVPSSSCTAMNIPGGTFTLQ